MRFKVWIEEYLPPELQNNIYDAMPPNVPSNISYASARNSMKPVPKPSPLVDKINALRAKRAGLPVRPSLPPSVVPPVEAPSEDQPLSMSGLNLLDKDRVRKHVAATLNEPVEQSLDQLRKQGINLKLSSLETLRSIIMAKQRRDAQFAGRRSSPEVTPVTPPAPEPSPLVDKINALGAKSGEQSPNLQKPYVQPWNTSAYRDWGQHTLNDLTSEIRDYVRQYADDTLEEPVDEVLKSLHKQGINLKISTLMSLRFSLARRGKLASSRPQPEIAIQPSLSSPKVKPPEFVPTARDDERDERLSYSSANRDYERSGSGFRQGTGGGQRVVRKGSPFS